MIEDWNFDKYCLNLVNTSLALRVRKSKVIKLTVFLNLDVFQ